jgi:hypothetical protein
MAKNTAYFVAAVRQLTNTESDPIVTDTEIANRCSEALASLYDIIIGAYEHYAVTSFDFTLAGGVGGNSVALPTDFYKDVSLDLNPTSAPVTIHRFSSWIERNNLPRRQYTVIGSSLVVSPPQLSAGNFRLSYTPLIQPFSAPLTTPTPNAADSVDGTTNSWFFSNGAFDASYAGAAMTVTGCTNPLNNGTFTVSSVTDPTDIKTSGALDSENFGTAATVVFQPAGTINDLPQILAPWYEYIQVQASIAVKDKIEQDTSDLEVRLSRLTARITSMAGNRMEEGGQIALTRDLGGWWNSDNWPFGS